MTIREDQMDISMDEIEAKYLTLFSMHSFVYSKFFTIGFVAEALHQGIEDGIVKADTGILNESMEESTAVMQRMNFREWRIDSKREVPPIFENYFESLNVLREELYESTSESLQNILDRLVSLKGDIVMPNIDRALTRLDESLSFDVKEATLDDSPEIDE